MVCRFGQATCTGCFPHVTGDDVGRGRWVIGLAVRALMTLLQVKLGIGERLGRGWAVRLAAAAHGQPHHFLRHVTRFLLVFSLPAGRGDHTGS